MANGNPDVSSGAYGGSSAFLNLAKNNTKIGLDFWSEKRKLKIRAHGRRLDKGGESLKVELFSLQ